MFYIIPLFARKNSKQSTIQTYITHDVRAHTHQKITGLGMSVLRDQLERSVDKATFAQNI